MAQQERSLTTQIIDLLKNHPQGLSMTEIFSSIDGKPEIMEVAQAVWSIDSMGIADLGTKGPVEFTDNHKFRLTQPSESRL